MRELETLVKGVFKKDFLLDYLRNYILFEEIKKASSKK